MPKRDRVVPAGVLVGLDMAVGAGVPCCEPGPFRPDHVKVQT